MAIKFPARVDIKYVKKASRIELFTRFLLGFVYCIIAEVWGIVVVLLWIIQWLIVLVTGKRNKDIYDFTASFWRYLTRVYSYVFMLTDKRPPISGRA